VADSELHKEGFNCVLQLATVKTYEIVAEIMPFLVKITILPVNTKNRKSMSA